MLSRCVSNDDNEFRHCEERSDEAIHGSARTDLDCFAALAMTARSDLEYQVLDECPTRTHHGLPVAKHCPYDSEKHWEGQWRVKQSGKW